MNELGREYQLADEEEILAFLERYLAVAPLLHDIRSNIRRFFGEGPVSVDRATSRNEGSARGEPLSHLACSIGNGSWHSPTNWQCDREMKPQPAGQ